MDEVVLFLENIQQVYSQGDKSTRVLLVIKGNLEVTVGDGPSHLKAEDILIINRNQAYTILGDTKNLVLLLELGEDYLKKECAEFLDGQFVCDTSCDETPVNTGVDMDRSAVSFELKRRLMRILIAYINRSKGFKAEMKAGLFSFLAYLQKYFWVAAGNSRQPGDEESSIQEIQAYIRENFWQDLSLETVAKRAFMSPSYFSRYFKKVAGVGFLNYLMDIRLDHATADLVGTDESILRIAIRHGFASAKALSTAFKNKYGVLPSDYRIDRKNREQTEKHEDIRTRFDINLMSSDFEFLRFLRDSKEGASNVEAPAITVSLATVERQPIAWPAKIVLIDGLSSLYQAETIRQLRYIQEKLHFQYVYFDVNDETILLWLTQWTTFGFYEFAAAFDILYKIKLIPIFRLSYTEVKQVFVTKGGTPELIKYIRKVLDQFSGDVHLKSFIAQCKLEVYCPEDEDSAEFGAFYCQLVQSLEDFLAPSCFGILGLTDMAVRSREHLVQTLTCIAGKGVTPGFLSFYARPNREMAADTLVTDYPNRVLLEVLAAAKLAGCKPPDIFMVKWDTLYGKNAAEITTFFRSALAFDTILGVSTEVTGVGFELNTFNTLHVPYLPEKINMALFLHRRIKRPLYFVVDALNRMGTSLLFYGENTIATMNRSNELIFASYYPCYVNPSHILDYAYARDFTQKRTIRITGFEQGLYQIKRYTYDRECTSVSRVFEDLGARSFLNDEEIEFIEGALSPRIHIAEETIQGDYLLHENIAFNGILVVKFRKMDGSRCALPPTTSRIDG